MTDKDQVNEDEQQDDDELASEVPTSFATKGEGGPAGRATISTSSN